jgi:hypothetical protein
MRRGLDASIAVNVLAQFSMADFEVTLYGRFWVTPEELAKVARRDREHFDCATWLHRARELRKRPVKTVWTGG